MLAVPGFVGNALDPIIGVLGDTARRRALLVGGGLAFALSALLTAVSTSFWLLLLALVLGNPASTAFVSLAQASLMDLDPRARERNLAWWTLAGSVGLVGGPVLLAVALALGGGWREASVGLAVAALGVTLVARHAPLSGGNHRDRWAPQVGDVLRALRRREVLRWLGLLEASDLMLDVFHGFLALYFVDVAGFGPVEAGLAVAVWTSAGLVGDALLVVLLRRVPGTSYLRASALAVACVYPLFLLLPSMTAKLGVLALLGLLNSGWYAIPKAGLYAALPGRSGTAIAVGSLTGFAGAAIPLGLGLTAQYAGLGATMWLLLLAPVALLAGLPRARCEPGPRRDGPRS